VNNDFQQTHAIFDLFDGLEVKDMDKPIATEDAQPAVAPTATNGSHVEPAPANSAPAVAATS
jgi:hypothetical protein